MHIDRNVRVERKTTVTLTEEQAADLLRKAVGAPDNAKVAFDISYEILNEVVISWTEVEEKGE